ncbi:MAG: SRPBCC family protein [Capnocytophaga sp.]|nr:SRPBCC family protein [Capnocytophaga sp.]
MTKIHINTLIHSELEKVWDCYTNPTHIVNWNFASPDWHCPKAENDMQVGGKYTARMEAKDGSFGFDFEAIYTEVKPLESFTYKILDGREVQVKFTPKENSTQLDITFEAENQNPIEMQQAGWQAILDNFKRYVEK